MTDSEPESAREVLSLIALAEWEPLGGSVSLDVSPRRTVLVGRNGSGKSLMVAGVGHLLAQRADKMFSLPRGAGSVPTELVLGFQKGDQPSLSYVSGSAVMMKLLLDTTGDPELHRNFEALLAQLRSSRTERVEVCTDPQAASRWICVNGILFSQSPRLQIPVLDFVVPRRADTWGSIAEDSGTQGLRDTVERVSRVFFGARLVPAGIPRRESVRSMILLDGSGTPVVSAFNSDERVVRLVVRIRRWKEAHPDLFTALLEFGRRNRLWSRLEVVSYQASATSSLFGVHVDDVNLGFLPDGTLRVLEIAVELIDPEVKLLLIEEPETAIHPWLLGRLLVEMDAACETRQIIVSTHSPMVVDWASPEELRLVERTDGKTTVRRLSDEERERVHTYLSDEGTLAEYVYERTEA